jgi:hydrogenase nickel incorporation protein HypA/HybF
MHELSIALSIIDIAEQEVKKNAAREVVEIELEVGRLSGVEPYALDFAWDQAILNTVLEKAERKTNYIEARAKCQECGLEFEIENVYDECPSCKSYLKELISGRELRVKSLTVI